MESPLPQARVFFCFPMERRVFFALRHFCEGTITAQIDLKELLYGRPGDDEAEWILEIPINRESGRGYRPERGDSTK